MAGALTGAGFWLASTLTPAVWLGIWAWPVAAAGQAILLLGVSWQLERISLANRVTRDELESVSAQLLELRQATSRPSGQAAISSTHNYAHPAEVSSDQMLLADVKSQLDLLALRMSRGQR